MRNRLNLDNALFQLKSFYVGACVGCEKGSLEHGPTPAEDFDPILFYSCDTDQVRFVSLFHPFLVFN